MIDNDRHDLRWLWASTDVELPAMTLKEAVSRIGIDIDVHYGAPVLRESGMLLGRVLDFTKMFGVKNVLETYEGRLSYADMSAALVYAREHPELFGPPETVPNDAVIEYVEVSERQHKFLAELTELSRQHGCVVGTGYDGAVIETMPEDWRGYWLVNRGRLRHLPKTDQGSSSKGDEVGE